MIKLSKEFTVLLKNYLRLKEEEAELRRQEAVLLSYLNRF